MTLTEKEYVSKGGVRCPVCRSGDIEGGSVNISYGDAFQGISCLECPATWTDVYALTHYSDLDTEV